MEIATGSDTCSRFPKVDFSDLDLDRPESQQWRRVGAQVMAALDCYGFFQAVLGEGVERGPATDELFGPAMEELFSIPHEAKLRNLSDKPYQGFIDRSPGGNYESFCINEAGRYDSLRAFTELVLSPDGNPDFICDKMWMLAKRLSSLELAVRRMVAEGLGVEGRFASLVDSTLQTMRIARYDSPADQETMVTIGAHTDMNLMTVIFQHERQGLEVRSRGGEWLLAPPNSFTVMPSESFEVWSNGRLKPTVHRVRMRSNETRYSIGFGSQFRYGRTIRAPEELVDEEHPELYEPYEYAGYLAFRFSEAGLRTEYALEAYCGRRRGPAAGQTSSST